MNIKKGTYVQGHLNPDKWSELRCGVVADVTGNYIEVCVSNNEYVFVHKKDVTVVDTPKLKSIDI